MGLTKAMACFVVVLLVVGKLVRADCLNDCYAGCIGYESTMCMLGCYYKCKWKQRKKVEELVANLTPKLKAKLHEIEEKEAKREAESETSRKLRTTMKF